MASLIKKIVGLSAFIFLFLLIQAFVPTHVLSVEKAFRNSLGMEFVLIPAGTFVMGSPLDEPHRNKKEIEHQVTITKPFYMQTTEVTLKQWWALMGKKLFGRRKGKENMPVVKVSWFDSVGFIKKLNALNEGIYRLPSEAEWEYASRAGSRDAFSWGKDIDCTKAMYSNNSLKSGDCVDYVKSRGLAVDSPAPVRSYSPNAWGLYDMHGNVWEWCQDWWYDKYPGVAVKDPKGPDSPDPGTKKLRKVRRGGSWFRYGYSCRSANRAYAHPGARFQTTGFRVLREAP
jgi:formylglycine-generating enzyme required for sulfatase activity